MILFSSFSTVNPINPSSLNTQTYTVTFVAMNNSVKTLHGRNHQFTPEKYLHQIDAYMICTMGEQPLGHVAYNQWRKRRTAYKQSFKSGNALGWFFCDFMKVKKMTGLALYLLLKNIFSPKNCILRTIWSSGFNKRETENVGHYAPKMQHIVEKGCFKESAATINPKCKEFFTRGLPNKLKSFAHTR